MPTRALLLRAPILVPQVDYEREALQDDADNPVDEVARAAARRKVLSERPFWHHSAG